MGAEDLHVPSKEVEEFSPSIIDESPLNPEDLSSAEETLLTSDDNTLSDDTSSSSDEILISTWSNGELVETSPTKILLPAFTMENEEPFLEQLANSQNFVANSSEVEAFSQSIQKQQCKKYSQLFNFCTTDVQPSKKFDVFLRVLLLLNKDSFPSESVLPWQKSSGDPTSVRIIHGKRKEFKVSKQ